MVDSGETVEEVVSEHSSMKKKDKKKKNRETKDGSVGDIIGKKSKKKTIDSEIEDDGTKLKKKKKSKEQRVDSEAEDGAKEKSKKKKKSKKESGSDVIGNSESSKVDEEGIEGNQKDEKPLDDANMKTGKRKRDESDLGTEENTEAKEMKRKSKKKKPIMDSMEDAKRKKSKPSVDSEIEENSKDSTKDAKKQKKTKKKAKQSVDSEVEDIKLKSTESAKQKSKEKKRTEDLEATEDSKKKRKLSEVSEAEENNKGSMEDAKEQSKEKKQSEDSEAEENDLNSAKVTKKKTKNKKQSENSEKKKRKKKQESDKSDKDVTTPSSKSTKRVKFSDQVEIFPTDDEESVEGDEVKLLRGKRYTKEEDALIKASVLEYIDNHALGDEGIKMVMECKSHPQIKGCWKEITSAIPWRTYDSVYNRAHTIFEEGSRGVWSKEDMQLIIEFQKKHGNDWRTLADAMGKHRKHVKDAWRRIRLESKNKGHWTREEYQNLFDLVNKDLRMKAFQEKHSKHGMLRDNIPWMAISDELGSRDHVMCCGKWYDQLQSPMIAKGIWANVDDYRLLEELLKLDAACIDDVDWDNLLENRDGEACRKRWNQMVLHIGSPRSKTFAEQVEILSQRYCPDIAEDREDFDNRPYDPDD